MKPEGRKPFKQHTAKHHVKKCDGRGWWEVMIEPNKAKAKREAYMEMEQEMEQEMEMSEENRVTTDTVTPKHYENNPLARMAVQQGTSKDEFIKIILDVNEELKEMLISEARMNVVPVIRK